MKRVLFISSSLYPEGQAYSTRIIGFVRLLESLGIKVHVIAGETKRSDIVRGEVYNLDDSTFIITGKPGRLNRMLFNRLRAESALRKTLSDGSYDAVITNAESSQFPAFRRICRRYGVPLYLEICEWFDITSYKLRKFDYRYYQMKRMMKNGYRKADGVIAISTLLQEHFSGQGVRAIRIPTLTDVALIPHDDNRKKDVFTLVHAGTAVIHKEKFRNIMLAILNIDSSIPIEYRIYGSPYETVLANVGGDKELLQKMGDRLKIMGAVPHDEVFAAYEEADFSVFIRDNKLSSNAGFPTKLAESMAAGAPVISNDTGDIGMYIKDGVSGFLLQNGSVAEIEVALRKAISLTEEEKCKMRAGARQIAEESFDFRSYHDMFNDFLGGDSIVTV